jgi:acetyl esterase/lipase
MPLLDPSKPTGNPPGGPKYGHLSFPLHETFAAMKPTMDAAQSASWSRMLQDISAGRDEINATGLLLLPDPCPQPGADYEVVDETFPARDGTKIGMRFYKPSAGKQNKSGVWVYKTHGGGFVVGTHQIEEVENRYLAAAGFLVASVDYRLAPEYRFPYAVTDSWDGLKWCIDNAERLSVNPDKIVTAGGSAGGNLAIVMALKAKHEGLKGIVGCIANIPVTIAPELYDLLPQGKHELRSIEQNWNASGVDKEKMKWFFEAYLPGGTSKQSEVGGERQEYHSPLLAKDLSGFPPTLVQVAGYDPLRDEGLEFAERLKEAGVMTELKIYPGLPHGFYVMTMLKETEEYWQASVSFAKRFDATN